MAEQGYKYLDKTFTVQSVAKFFKSRFKETKPGTKKAKKDKKSSKKHKAMQFDKDSEEESSVDERLKVRESTAPTTDTVVILQIRAGFSKHTPKVL